MSRPSKYEGVRWTEADMIHELELLLVGSVIFSYNGSKSSELRETYDRRRSILNAVLATVKSNMADVWEVRARAHQQASEAKDAEIARLTADNAALRADLQGAHEVQKGLYKDNLAYAAKSAEDEKQIDYWKKAWLTISDERDALAERVRVLEAGIDKLNEQWTHKHVVNTPLDKAVVDVLLVRYPPAALAPAPQAQENAHDRA